MNILELREQRAKCIVEARKVIDAADTEKRSLNNEENQKVDNLFAQADKFEADINTQEKRESLEAAEAKMKEVRARKAYPTLSNQENAPDYTAALRSWLIKGATPDNGGTKVSINGNDIENAVRCGIDLSSSSLTLNPPAAKYLTRSNRAMSTTGSATGAELVAWKEYFNGFYEVLKYYGPCLNLVSYIDSSAGVPMPVPVLDDTANVAEILTETNTVAAADVATANVSLGAFKYSSKEVILSLELLQDSQVDLEAYVGKALAVRFARKWNSDITIGTGTTLPYGLNARATDSGVVSDGSAATPTFTTNGANLLFDLADALDDAYRSMPGVGYMMHRTTFSKLRKLKDDNLRYIFDPNYAGVTQGNPGTLNGYPIYVNPDMPTSGASKALILFGDYSSYVWRRVGGPEFHRLNEYRIRSGQVSFLAFARADGTLPNAKAVVKLLAPAS